MTRPQRTLQHQQEFLKRQKQLGDHWQRRRKRPAVPGMPESTGMRTRHWSFPLTVLAIGFTAGIVSAQSNQNKRIDAVVAGLEKLGATRLVENGAKASFSPDGTQIVYSKMPFGAGIVLLDIESGKSADLVATGKDPSFSPGEKPLVAYVRGNSNEEEVWVVQPDGENDRKIAAGGFPTWSGDGQTLYFHARTRPRLMAVDFSAGKPQPVELKVTIPSWYPAVSPDGSTVAFMAQGALVITDVAEPGYTVRPLPALTRGGLPGWSADGKQVGYGGFGYEDHVGLWVYNLQARKARRIVDGPCTMPAWSQDGSKLVFDLRAARDHHEIWMIETQALNPEKESGEE